MWGLDKFGSKRIFLEHLLNVVPLSFVSNDDAR